MSHRSSHILLNVPKEYWSLRNFRSTLGHKVNHSFTKSNVIFISVIHPRHGPIKAAVSTKKIHRGQEILYHYNYDMDSYIPTWYAKTYERDPNLKWPKTKIFDETDNVDPIFGELSNIRVN